jgi:hypothetical protein
MRIRKEARDSGQKKQMSLDSFVKNKKIKE